MPDASFNGIEVLWIALALCLCALVAHSVRRARERQPAGEQPREPFAFRVADDLADQRRARPLRQASAYREHLEARDQP